MGFLNLMWVFVTFLHYVKTVS